MPFLKHCSSLFSVALAAMLILVLGLLSAHTFADDSSTAAADSSSKQFIAYYFHNEYRCPSCIKIEKWSHETLQASFSDALKTGTLEWKPINTDLPANKHYEEDYQLYTKSLIISEIKNDKEVKWKNLEKVWHYLGNEKKFKNYVLTELNTFMEK